MKNNSSYKIIETRPQEIMSLDFVKNYIRISHNNDDALIVEMIEAAMDAAENYIAMALKLKIVETVIYNANEIWLPLIPVARILEVKSDDIVLRDDDFIIRGPRIRLEKLTKTQKLEVRYIAGYEDPKHIPTSVKHGILIHVTQLYDNRGNPSVFTDRIFEIYRPYRKRNI